MTISQIDMFSHSRGEFDTVTINMLYGIEVRGNFLAARSKYTEFIYDLYDLTSAGHYSSALVGTGLSTDGSDRVSLEVLRS